MIMQKEIAEFIESNRIAAISCAARDSSPYIFHCFYAFDLKNKLFFFKSAHSTFHSSLLNDNPRTAGSILPEKVNLLALKGIQFTGVILGHDLPESINPAHFYHKKFPFAIAKPGKVWCSRLDKIKMTDNTRAFGAKLKWERTES